MGCAWQRNWGERPVFAIGRRGELAGRGLSLGHVDRQCDWMLCHWDLQSLRAGLYILASVIFCLVGVWLGHIAGLLLNR